MNLLENGTLEAADGSPIEDEAALREHLKSERSRVEALGEEPVLFLRGNKQTVFEHCRRVIRIGVDAGVDRVVFGTYAREKSEEMPGKKVDR